MLSITLFRLLFCYFRFNWNTETLFFGVEPKQLKKTFFSDSAETSFGSSFGCFESKLVSKNPLIYRGQTCQSHGPWLGRKVDSGIGLSCRPTRLHRLAGRYGNPMPASTISPIQRLWIWQVWLQDSIVVIRLTDPLTWSHVCRKLCQMRNPRRPQLCLPHKHPNHKPLREPNIHKTEPVSSRFFCVSRQF